MGRWKEAFEAGLLPPHKREYGEEYFFGQPASDAELQEAEQKLGFRLPAELRELLQEFNGLWCSSRFSRELGHPPAARFLDLRAIAGILERPEMIDMIDDRNEEYGDLEAGHLPGEDFRKIAFFWETNGGADRYGICAEAVAGFPAGSVVRVDHESSGEIIAGFPDLLSFLNSDRCR